MESNIKRHSANYHTESLSLSQNNIRNKLPLRFYIFTFICLLLILLALRLGFWQLTRADYHHKLLQQYALAEQAQIDQHHESGNWQLFQRISVAGSWLPQQVLVDSQMHRGEIGYNVLQLFQSVDGQTLWVDRGFVVANNRQTLPLIPSPDYTATDKSYIAGQYYFSDKWQRAKLHVEVLGDNHWRISAYHPQGLLQLGGTNTIAGVLRLQQPQALTLQANWQVVAVTPEKNYAYAVQWFAIAAGLLLAIMVFLWHNIRENNKDAVNGNDCSLSLD